MKYFFLILLVLFVACNEEDSDKVLEFYPHYNINISVVDKEGNDLFDRDNTYRVFATLLEITPLKSLSENDNETFWWGNNTTVPFFHTWMDEYNEKINVYEREQTGSFLLDSLYKVKFAEGIHGASLVSQERFDLLVKTYNDDDPKYIDVPDKYKQYKLYSIPSNLGTEISLRGWMMNFDENMESKAVLKWEMTDHTITTDTLLIKGKVIKHEKGKRLFYNKNGEIHYIEGEYQLIDEVFVNGQKLWDLDKDGVLIDYNQYQNIEELTLGDILKETPYIVLVK
jgi:hypothetical protein